MTRFIPREKLSKKARRELDGRRRAVWLYSPITKKIESKKIYNRKKSHVRFEDDGMGFCCMTRADGGPKRPCRKAAPAA